MYISDCLFYYLFIYFCLNVLMKRVQKPGHTKQHCVATIESVSTCSCTTLHTIIISSIFRGWPLLIETIMHSIAYNVASYRP